MGSTHTSHPSEPIALALDFLSPRCSRQRGGACACIRWQQRCCDWSRRCGAGRIWDRVLSGVRAASPPKFPSKPELL